MHVKSRGGSRQLFFPVTPGLSSVSIIVVTLNAERHIEDCLNSIIQQPFQNIELIIFDGGSEDGTIGVFEKYDKHITLWRSEADKGIYDAMNKAVSYATGQWVYFLGSDDRLLTGFAQLAAQLKEPQTIYYGDMSYNGEATSRRKYSAYRLAKETICHQAIMYPRAVFDFYSYNLAYPLAADWALNLQLWGDERFGFKFYPYVVADFCLSGASTMNKDVNFLRDQPELIKKSLGIGVYLRFWVKRLRKKL